MDDSEVTVNDNSQNEDLQAAPPKSQSGASGNENISLSLAVPIATGFLYLIFAIYMAKFCSVLSLPFGSLDLPNSFYLHSINELLSPLYMTLVVVYITRQSHYNKFHNTAVAYIAPIILFLIYISYTNSVILSFVVLFSFLVYESILLDQKVKMSKTWEAGFVIYILIIASGSIGSSSGTNIITGGHGSSEIELELNDANISAPNGTLILVLYTNNIYYVVEKCVPPPQNPRLHIIPKEQVKSANIERVTTRNTPFYEDWAYTLVDFWRGNALPFKPKD